MKNLSPKAMAVLIKILNACSQDEALIKSEIVSRAGIDNSLYTYTSGRLAYAKSNQYLLAKETGVQVGKNKELSYTLTKRGQYVLDSTELVNTIINNPVPEDNTPANAKKKPIPVTESPTKDLFSMEAMDFSSIGKVVTETQEMLVLLKRIKTQLADYIEEEEDDE